MIMEFNLEKDDLIILDTILGYKKVGTEELKIMVEFMRKHVDAGTTVCTRCPTQIRFAHKKLVNWTNTNELKINELRYGKQEEE